VACESSTPATSRGLVGDRSPAYQSECEKWPLKPLYMWCCSCLSRCPADAGMSLIVELQTVVVGASASLESCAWAKLFIFDGKRLLTGRWHVPFRQLPFEDTDAPIMDSVQACIVIKLIHMLQCLSCLDYLVLFKSKILC